MMTDYGEGFSKLLNATRGHVIHQISIYAAQHRV